MHYLGIDIGSTTLKAALKNNQGELLFSDYQRHNADIRLTATRIFTKIYQRFGNLPLRVVMTGSVGMGFAPLVHLTFVQEVVASAQYINESYPQVHTFIDMGGEDSKMIFFEKGRVPDMRMNGSCAGGTGSFIDQAASLLNVENSELNALAERSTQLYPIASRCGVYAKTDIQNLMARGVGKPDIVISTFRALAQQVIGTLARGVDIKPPIFFCGGPFAFLPELSNQFCAAMGFKKAETICPQHAELIPALGCCCVAQYSEHEGETPIAPVSLIQLIVYSRFAKQPPTTEVQYKDRIAPLFKDALDYKHWLETKRSFKVPRASLSKDPKAMYFLGVDSGSTTTKLVLLNTKKELVYSDYRANGGDSFSAFHEAMKQMYQSCGNISIQYSCATGYGENLLKTAFSLNEGLVETIAHSVAAKRVMPHVSFVLDIGGQDMKAIFINEGAVTRIEINEACSSGCGSFLETFANLLHYSVSDFATMACKAQHPCDLGTRCTVFMNSKVKQAMREGAEVEDIAAGFSYSVIKNCLYKVLKLKNIKELGSAIVVQGGTFKNLSVVKALEELTGCEVRYTDIPELMGAYGSALHACDAYLTHPIAASSLSDILALQTYTSHVDTCPGCENHCLVKVFNFAHNRTFVSGNNCEKVYSNQIERRALGANLFNEKYRLLFAPKSPIYTPNIPFRAVKIGLPRALGMYEKYPFWRTLFETLGFQVVLSSPSTNKMVAKGSASIMADNVCFPAKVMHGHIYDLAEKKPDYIFYPYVVYEKKEDKKSNNSYNCPIVAGYSDVIRSAINPEKRFGIPFHSPIISFNDNTLLLHSCQRYFMASFPDLKLGKHEIAQAVTRALEVQDGFLKQVEDRSNKVLDRALKEHRLLIVLASRPYQVDPLVEHKISTMISEMGLDVISENVAMHSGVGVYDGLHAVSQWSYPNRVFKAAHLVASLPSNIQFVELNSFGCGPDAFILDEVTNILQRGHKFPTVLKIDDVSNLGSLRLRIRSLVENYRLEHAKLDLAEEERTKAKAVSIVKSKIKLEPKSKSETQYRLLPLAPSARFEVKDKDKKILVPYFAEGYSEFLGSIFKFAGYDTEMLPMGNQLDVEEGLKYVNNDVCYPAIIVVGSLMRALKSGRYDLDHVALMMSQTGGQCRASNYISLIKNALLIEGLSKIPVISLAVGPGITNHQPGFKLNWRKLALPVCRTMLYADCLSKLYYATAPRSGDKVDDCRALRMHYIAQGTELIEKGKTKEMVPLLREAVQAFTQKIVHRHPLPKVGVVGEIFVKYNPFSHKSVVDWFVRENIEVVPTMIYNFFSTSLVNAHVNRTNFIEKSSLPLWINDQIYRLIDRQLKIFDKACQDFPYYTPFSDIFENMKKAERIVSPATNFGEGWLIPAEISTMAEHGVENIVSLQPFGCTSNHLIAKGIEKRVKDLYPQMSLLFLDFDASTSEANVYNRLHFMLNNAKQQVSKKAQK